MNSARWTWNTKHRETASHAPPRRRPAAIDITADRTPGRRSVGAISNVPREPIRQHLLKAQAAHVLPEGDAAAPQEFGRLPAVSIGLLEGIFDPLPLGVRLRLGRPDDAGGM